MGREPKTRDGILRPRILNSPSKPTFARRHYLRGLMLLIPHKPRAGHPRDRVMGALGAPGAPGQDRAAWASSRSWCRLRAASRADAPESATSSTAPASSSRLALGGGPSRAATRLGTGPAR